MPPGIVAEVLDADERGLGAAGESPATGASHDIAPLDRSVEEVVGGQEHEAAAAVPKAGHDVELVPGHVFVVTGEDIRSYASASPRPVVDGASRSASAR